MPINKFSRTSTALAFVFAFTSAIAINSQAATVSGTSCSQAGNQLLEGKKLFTCVKSGSKLSWKYTDDNTSAFAPFPLVGPSWLEIAQQKDLLEKAAFERAAKEAAELKGKSDAEIAAALKARLAEEAKAAKAESEKPKIQGLVIGKLLWGDDFAGQAGSQASSTSWTPRFCGQAASNGGGTCHNNEQQYYIPEAIAQDGSAAGNLIITTKRITQPPTNAGICYVGLCSFTSGRLDTQGKLSFKYGFIEARIKMPAGSGNWPAFWMLGDNINQVGWPYSGEMDIVEIHSDRPSIVTSATHFSITDTPNTCCGNHRFVFDEVNFGRVDVSSGFHTYAIAWLPNSISYYFDGQLVGSATPSRVSGKWVFNEKFFLILNNAVGSFGGSWANLQGSTMSIDWVRSYQVNGYGEVFTQ